MLPAEGVCPPGKSPADEAGCLSISDVPCGTKCCKENGYCYDEKKEICREKGKCYDCKSGMTRCVNGECSYDRVFSVIINSTVSNTYCSVSDFPNMGKPTTPACFGTGANAIGPFKGNKHVSLPEGCLLINPPKVTIGCNQGWNGTMTCINNLTPPISGKTYVYPQDFKPCHF